jgi:prophage regulatory protein
VVADVKEANMDSESQNGLLRLSRVLQLIPVSRSTWWAGVKSGRFPKPVKLGPRITCWYWQDIQTLMEKPPIRL